MDPKGSELLLLRLKPDENLVEDRLHSKRKLML